MELLLKPRNRREDARESAGEQLHCKIPSMSKVLSVTQLCKTYGEIVAVDGISFDVGRNEIVGLLGPNGGFGEDLYRRDRYRCAPLTAPIGRLG